jgi:uncharacterized protein YbaP (TraB family)
MPQFPHCAAVPLRRRRLARFCTFAFAAALGLCATAVAQTPARPGAKSFLWKVQSDSSSLYLAGSVHALSADVYPLNPVFERAFQASDMLVEEIDLSAGDLMSIGPMLLAKGTYLDGRTFASAVSKETLALVEKRLDSPSLQQLIQGMKPWMVMLMLTAMQVQQAGLDVNLGLDKYFFDKATKAGKTIVGLETAESQIDRFDRMPEALQEQLLRSALEEIDAQSRELATIVAAWQQGDVAALERTLLGGFKQYPAAYQSLIVERNQNWMPQLETCLARATPCLVVVGAAHLVGPDGLLVLLQKRGYRLEQQ